MATTSDSEGRVSRVERGDTGVDWDAEAVTFDEEPDHGLHDPEVRRAWAERLEDWLPERASDVLDLGCGTGSLALLAAERGHRVTGVDLSPAMVDRARAKLVPRQATLAPSRRPARSPKLFEQGGPPLAAPAESPSTSGTRASGRHSPELFEQGVPPEHAPPGSRLRSSRGTPMTPLPDGQTVPAAAPAGRAAVFLVGDAAAPPVGEERFDVVLVRHVLWALPDPARALRRWCGLHRPLGRLVLVEGVWGTVGISAERLTGLLAPLTEDVRVERLSDDARLWGRKVADERYAVVARPASR